MELDELKARMSDRLASPLPGHAAYQQMVPTLYRKARFNWPPESEGKQSGVLVLLYEKGGEIHLPLIQRPVYEKGAHSGQISFPGGKYEPEDIDIVATALREAHEEVGVVPQQVEVIGGLSKLYIQPSGFWVQPTLATTPQAPQFVPDTYEVAEVLETTLSHLSQPHTIKHGSPMPGMPEFPYFDVDGRIVWGATAMMLAELIHIYREIQ